jgi:hypothetical protein
MLRAFLPRRDNVLNQIDLDSLLIHLRQELDNIEQAILALEQMALSQRPDVRVPDRRTSDQPAVRAGAGKKWTKHRARTE